MKKIFGGILFAFCCLLLPLPAETGEPLWRFITGGRVRSYPAVGRDGNVYILSDDRFLYSLTPRGEQRWRYYLEERLTDCFAIGYDGTVYIGYKTGELIAVHGYGRSIWKFDTGGTISQPPAIRRDGSVCLATEEGMLFAVMHTGALLYKQALPGPPATPPAVDADNSLYLGLKTGELVAIQPWGELRWRLPLTGLPSSPVIGADGTVYVGTAAGLLYAVEDLPKIRWTASFQGALFPPVIGRNETLYAASAAGELAALSPDGETIWSIPLGEIPSGPCVLGDGGTIFVATQRSTLFAVDPLGGIRRSFRVKGVLTRLMLARQPILYAGSSDWAVYAFPAESLAATTWPVSQRDPAHSGASARDYRPLSFEERYRGVPDYVYFQSLFLSGDAELMDKGLEEIRLLAAENRLKEKTPYLLHFLKSMAGYTVIEDEKTVRFPLRGFSPIRQEACELYTDLAGQEAYPLLLRVLKQDADFRMKTVAVRCLGRLRSAPDGEAARAMARLILVQAGGQAVPDDTFARETVVALKNMFGYHGALPREGVQALVAIGNGPYLAEVRSLAQSALKELGRGR